MRTSPAQLAFSSGELDPLLHRRSDYQRFQTGLARCRGFLPLPQGGFTRAPGTIWRGQTHGNQRGILIPFQFAANDALCLEFTPGRMRVWRYGELVMSGGSPYSIITPYDADALDRLNWVQSADVIYLVDGEQPMHRLARFALDSWTLTPVNLRKGPFKVQNTDDALQIEASAETGAITLSTNWDYFVAGMVGMLLRLQPTDNTAELLWTSNESAVVGDRRRYGENIYQLTRRDGGDVGDNPPIHTEGTALSDNQTAWRFVGNSTGIVRIAAVAGPRSASAQVLQRVPKACVDDATYRWSEGAWSAISGYPSTVEIFDQRLVAAATPTEPRSVWFSAVGDFADFGDGTEDDSPFAYTIAGSASVNRITALKRGRSGLHIFALGEEYASRSESRAQVIGPTNTVFETIGNAGCNGARPIAPDGDPIFISRDEGRVLQVSYALESDSTRAANLTRPAQHLGASRFLQIEWQGAPEPTAWLRLASGDLAAMVYDRSEEVLGWAVIPQAGGAVESLAVVPDVVGAQDRLTMIVRREVGGETRFFVEEQASTFGLTSGGFDTAHHYFAARQVTGSDLQTVSLPHLAGETVHAWTDQGCFEDLAVAEDGTVALPVPVASAIVGLFDATHEAITLDVQAVAPNGNTSGRQKRIKAVAVGLHRTAQGRISVISKMAGRRSQEAQSRDILPRAVAAELSELQSGIVRVDAVAGLGGETQIAIRPYSGAPLTITSIVPTVEEAGE